MNFKVSIFTDLFDRKDEGINFHDIQGTKRNVNLFNLPSMVIKAICIYK